MPKPASTPFTEPEHVTEARRLALKRILEAAGGISRVAERAGLDRVHLERLVADPETTDPRGRRDILKMRSETILRLLIGLNMSDSAAQRELNIPKHLIPRWKTNRPKPMGQAEADRTGVLDVVLDEPLVVTLQPGYVMSVDTNNVLSGDILVYVNDRHLLVPADAIPANAKLIGQFVGVDALVRRPVPQPEI